MKNDHLLRLGAITLATGLAPLTMLGAMIQGTTAGKTVSGVGQDDVDTAATINISYQTFAHGSYPGRGDSLATILCLQAKAWPVISRTSTQAISQSVNIIPG